MQKPELQTQANLSNSFYLFSILPTTGYLLGETEEVNLLKDPAMLKRLNEINSLPDEEKKSILLTVDAFLRDAKTRKAYA